MLKKIFSAFLITITTAVLMSCSVSKNINENNTTENTTKVEFNGFCLTSLLKSLKEKDIIILHFSIMNQ